MVLQPSFVSEVTAPGRSALDSVEVAYGRQVSHQQSDHFYALGNLRFNSDFNISVLCGVFCTADFFLLLCYQMF